MSHQDQSTGSADACTHIPLLLSALRLGDSAFPSGGFAFSAGLEGAVRDGHIPDEDAVAAFVDEQITSRWHTGERVLLRSAWAARDPRTVDHLAEASTPIQALREASQRAGTATLGTFHALGYRAATDYRTTVRIGQTPGHLPVVQAICLRDAGLDLRTAEAVTGWQAINGITGAALRLGILGHLGAQRVITRCSLTLADCLRRRPPAYPATFSWFAEIAAQRSTGAVRLFAS